MAVTFVKAPSKLSIITLLLLYFIINSLNDEGNTKLNRNGLVKSLNWKKIRFSKHTCGIGDRGHTYFVARIPYTTKGVSYYQITWIVLSADIQVNPGPLTKTVRKRFCRDCGKSVRENQNAIQCVVCKLWSHAKCLGIGKKTINFYVENMVNWTCNWCSLPFNELNDSEIVHESNGEMLDVIIQSLMKEKTTQAKH